MSSFLVIYRTCDEFPKLMESNGDGLVVRRWLEEINLIASGERVKSYFKVGKRSYREQSVPFTLNAEITYIQLCLCW